METSEVIKKIENKVQFVNMLALNKTVAEMALFRYPNLAQEVFDRPTSFILKSFKYNKATTDNLTAEVYVDNTDYYGPVSPAHVLASEVFGGNRKPKRFEIALRTKGVLPSDQFVAPGKDARLDAYGNISNGQIVQVLSALGAYREQGSVANKSKRPGARMNKNTNNIFVINTLGRKAVFDMGGGLSELYQQHGSLSNRLQGLPMGIYQRIGQHGIKQLMKFVKQPHYDKQFKFFEEGERLAEKIFSTELTKAFNRYVNG